MAIFGKKNEGLTHFRVLKIVPSHIFFSPLETSVYKSTVPFLVKLHTEHADLQGCCYVCWSCHTHIRQIFFRQKVIRETLELHLSRPGGVLSTGTRSTCDSQIHCAYFRDYFYFFFFKFAKSLYFTLFIKMSP